jgi:hypothetical protein
MFQVTTLFSQGGGTLPYKDDGTIAFENDFFKRQAFLTVSGQLQAETYACALSSVYTFGPNIPDRELTYIKTLGRVLDG